MTSDHSYEKLLSKENRRKIEPKETPSSLISHLHVLVLHVFTRQLEILVTTLHKKASVNCRLL